MKCKHCGKENEEGSKFCMWCGQIFEEPKNSAKVQPDKISTQPVKNNSDGDSQSRKVSAQPKMSDTNMHNGQNTGYPSQKQNTYNNQNAYNQQNTGYLSQGQQNGNTSQGQNGYYDPHAAYQQPYGYNDPYGTQWGMNQNMNPNMVTQSPPIHTVIPNYNPSMDYTPLSMWGYFGYSIGFAILLLFPIFGWIIIALIAFGAIGNNIHVRNFARSYFCWVIIQLVFILLLTIGGVAIWSSLANSL